MLDYYQTAPECLTAPSNQMWDSELECVMVVATEHQLIDDSDHRLNLWQPRQAQQPHSRTDCYFPPSNANTEEQFNRFKKLDRHSSTHHPGPDRKDGLPEEHLPWRERVKHTTWAYFTMTMATGGIANVLHNVPFQSRWIHYVGLIFFFLNISLYIIIWAMLLTRFINHPKTFRSSLIHPTESLFVPAVLVSFGTICITIVEYGANNTGEWLTTTVLVLFWINVALAVTLSITIYMILWSSLTFTIAQMTPIWIFPAYPLLIIGPHAANLSGKVANPTTSLQVIVGGFTVQGIGFLVSLTIYSAFIYRLMTQKLPADPSRPGMFVSVGPAAFTCSGTIGMAQNLHRAIANQPSKVHMDVPAELAAQVLRLVGNWISLWLWGLALWFFFVSVISNVAPLWTHSQSHQRVDKEHSDSKEHAHIHGHKMPFAMTWYSYIFPQTALITATFRIAEAFNIRALGILGCVMAGLLIMMWIFVVGMMVRAVILKQILWPDKGEDKEEGGFVRPVSDAEVPIRKRSKNGTSRDVESEG